MEMIDPHAISKLQGELVRGERVYWAGMPNPRITFHSDDWQAIPFAIMFGGFSIFWETAALRSPSTFMALWGLPFVVIGQYLIWGRFIYDRWLKKRTYYGVTNRRVLIVQEGWKRKISSSYLEFIPVIEREGERTGTLWFGTKYPVIAGKGQKTRSMSRFSVGDVPVFADVDDVDTVYRMIVDLRDKAKLVQN
jgi:hypothetical protein